MCAGPLWSAAKAAKPGILIINPASGPGAAVDPAYASTTREMQAAGIKMLGYVSTSYGARNSSLVQEDVDK